MAAAEKRDSADKVRVRALDEAGKPVARIRVELVATSADATGATRKDSKEVVAVRSLSTSNDGFAIFTLGSVPAALRSEGSLAVRFAQSADLTFALDQRALLAGSQYIGYTLPKGPWAELEPATGPWHDDGLEPDDVWAIPGVFPDLGDLHFGDDYCGRLVPNDLTVRIANHNQVVRTGKNVITCLEDTNAMPGKDGAVVAGQGKDGQRRISLHEGELISYEIKCARLGYTFGDLLYSLPLAPCESVTLAISHWEQRQKARAEQETVSVEKRNATYYRQNALSEAMGAVSSDDHHGWALMAGNSSGSGGSGSGIISGVLLKATSAFQTTVGGSASASFNRAQFASNATRTFSDRIQSSAEAWRSDHQVVVMEQAETEDQQVSYRTVCNNNHCHVLNIFYHEVLNNFRVTTKMLGHREVYFVPYEVKDFDAHMALCKKSFLLPFLLDQDLAECYAHLKLAGGKPQTESKNTVDEFRIELKIAAVFGFIFPSNLFLVVQPNTGVQQTFPIVHGDTWQTGQSYSYIVNTPNIDPATLHDVGIMKIIGGSFNQSHSLQIESWTISVKDPVSLQWVPVATAGPVSSTGNSLFSSAPASYKPPDSPGALVAAADQACLDRVIAHLNCNKVYYNSLLWLLEDPNERICRFDKIVCGTSGDSLTDLILPEPVAVMGCSVAFIKANSSYVPYTGQPIVDERLLTLPTPGIFADAALGHCSACEKIDKDVYWNWKDSPCLCGGKDLTLKTPTESPLIQGGVSPFPGIATGVWATGVAPPSGEAAISNSLVGAFGGALATAMLAGKNSAAEMTALQDLLGKMTDALHELLPAAGDPPKPAAAAPEATPAATPGGG